MHFKALLYLRAVIDSGSFAGAARRMGVSQPAITMALQGLERDWGITLFEKVGRQKQPTRVALLAAERAAEFVRRIDDLVRLSAHTPDHAIGDVSAVLRVGMAPAATLLYGPTIERVWHAHAPAGLLQISAASPPEMLSSLLGNELDLVIAPRPRRHAASGLRRQSLHTSTPVIYARVGHPLAQASSLVDILHAHWAVAGLASTAGRVIEEAHRVRGLPPPNIAVQCADYPALLNFVAHSDLLCVVPHPALMPKGPEPELCPLQIRDGLPQYEVCLFWVPRRAGPQAPAVSAVLRALRQLADRVERG